ncbi:MAG: oligosaccharide flippase family protein [Planctomycetota bacterium]|jgi:O-antigen/teichoic acid export membrane protein
MIERSLDLIRTRTAKYTFTLFFGSLTAKGIALAILFALAHLLDRRNYELFAMALTIMWVVFEFTELGLNRSMVRQAAEDVEKGRVDRAAGLFRFVALFKIVLWVVVFLTCWLTSGPIVRAFMEGGGERRHVLLAVAAGIGLGGIVLLNGIFHSYKHFTKDVVLSVTQNVFKLAGVLLLAAMAKLGLDGAITVYAMAPWGAVLVGIFLVPRGIRRWGRFDRKDFAALTRFGGAFALIIFLRSLEYRLGIFLLKSLYPGEGEVADFFLAQQLNMGFLFLLGAYSTVMFSKISSMGGWREVIQVQKKSVLPLGLFALGVGLCIVAAGAFIPLLLPLQYAQTVPSARWLFLSLIFNIFGTPASMILFHAKRLWVIFATNLVAVCLLTLLAFGWIPRFGAPGLAAAQCVALAFLNLCTVVYALWIVRKMGRQAATERPS